MSDVTPAVSTRTACSILIANPFSKPALVEYSNNIGILNSYKPIITFVDKNGNTVPDNTKDAHIFVDYPDTPGNQDKIYTFSQLRDQMPTKEQCDIRAPFQTNTPDAYEHICQRPPNAKELNTPEELKNPANGLLNPEHRPACPPSQQ